MVLFAKNALTKAYLLGHRTALTATKSRGFANLIKEIPSPYKQLPHPEHVKSVNLWRNVFFVCGIPAILLINLNAFYFEDQHPKRPDFAPYEYMRKRNKQFPWGDGNHSLFHNADYNALPEGYETEDHHGHSEEH